MKKTTRIIFALLMVLAIPSGLVRANLSSDMRSYAETQQVQGIINGLTGISDAINAQTKAIQAAQKQAQIDALNQYCVGEMLKQIDAKDTVLRQTDKDIADYKTKMETMDMGNPSVYQEASSYLNSLYRLRAFYSDRYFGYIIDGCKNYKAPQTTVATQQKSNEQICADNNSVWNGKFFDNGHPQCSCMKGFANNSDNTSCVAQQTLQVAPISGTQCNGKSWSACNPGNTFYCPPTGDAQCVPIPSGNICNGKLWGSCQAGSKFFCPGTGDPQCITEGVPTVTAPTKNSNITTAPVEKPSNITAIETTTSVATSTEHKGLIPRFWSWFTGLFGL